MILNKTVLILEDDLFLKDIGAVIKDRAGSVVESNSTGTFDCAV